MTTPGRGREDRLWLSLAGCLVLAAYGCADRPPAEPSSYTVEELVPGMPFHGIHGLTVGPDGMLYVGSVVGQSIYRVDPASGAVEVAFGPPDGCADDVEFGADGRLYWTQLMGQSVVAAEPGGPIQVLAKDRIGINSIAFKQDGRLFATEVFDGDALYEIDPKGEREARQILAGIGGLNGFDFGPDGKLYGPLWFKKVVARVDIDSGALDEVATGFEVPAAANFDSQGRLFVLDTARGEVVRVDVASGERTVVAHLDPGLDNLAFAPDDRLFVTNMANNGIYEVDTDTGDVRTVVEGRLAVPAGLDLIDDGGREVLHVADTFAYRTVDPSTNEVTTVARVFENGLTNPLDVAVGDTHTLITFFLRGEVQLLDRATGRVASQHELPAAAGALALPGGRFLVAQIGPGTVVEMSAGGEVPRTVVDGLEQPIDLALAGDGRIYVSEAGAGRIVEVVLESGDKRVVAEGLAQPEGIDVTLAGSIVVAEVGARTVSRIDPRTGERTALAENLPLGLPTPPGMVPTFIPNGVAVSPSGAIYVSSDVDSAIHRLQSDGTDD